MVHRVGCSAAANPDERLVGICWLGLNGALFATLATRKSQPRLRARLFNWVIRNELRERRRPTHGGIRTRKPPAALQLDALPDSRNASGESLLVGLSGLPVDTADASAKQSPDSDEAVLWPREGILKRASDIKVQPTLTTEAPARVLRACLIVVKTAKMIVRPNATENAAKTKRGAITRSLLDHLNCTNSTAVDSVSTAAWRDRGRRERPVAIRKFLRWRPLRLRRTLETRLFR
jgi:hypothetical protein